MSLHVPEAARVPQTVNFISEQVIADALGEEDLEVFFKDDPEGWRVALVSEHGRVMADISALNAKKTERRYWPRQELADMATQRAELVEVQMALGARLQHVKTLIFPRRPGTSTSERSSIVTAQYAGNKFEQAQAHLRIANRLLREWAQEHGYAEVRA